MALPGRAMNPTPRSIFSDPTEDEKLYFNMIDRAFRKNDSRIISNGKPAHAVYILYKFFETASERIVICTGRLQRTFDGVRAYSEPKLIESASKFIRRGGSVKILIVDSPDVDNGTPLTDHPFVRSLLDASKNSGSLDIRQHKNPTSIVKENHFIVADGKSIRLEVNPEEAEAYVKVNDPDVGSQIERAFSEWMEEGESLHLGVTT